MYRSIRDIDCVSIFTIFLLNLGSVQKLWYVFVRVITFYTAMSDQPITTTCV